jgi:hypothetical protein
MATEEEVSYNDLGIIQKTLEQPAISELRALFVDANAKIAPEAEEMCAVDRALRV